MLTVIQLFFPEIVYFILFLALSIYIKLNKKRRKKIYLVKLNKKHDLYKKINKKI